MNATTEAPLLSILPDIGYKKIKNCAGGILNKLGLAQEDEKKAGAIFRKVIKGEYNSPDNLRMLLGILTKKEQK